MPVSQSTRRGGESQTSFVVQFVEESDSRLQTLRKISQNSMTPDELKARTQTFGLRIIRLVSALPKSAVGYVIGRQMLRSGTSVGANYRAACRAQSLAHFVSKLAIVEEEADETLYWLEMVIQSGLVAANRVEDLTREADEIIAIVSASRISARNRARKISKSKMRPVNRQSTIGNRQSYDS